MRSGITIRAAVLAAVLAGGPLPAAAAGSVVATVAGRPVTVEEVRQAREETDLKHSALNLPPAEVNAQALERVVRRRLIEADVAKRGLLDGPMGDRYRAVMIPAVATIYRAFREPEIAVGEDELQERAPAGLMERRRIRQIVMTERKEMDEVRRRAAAGEDFAALAREFSEGPAAGKGGDVGLLQKGEKGFFSEEMWEELYRLPTGGVSAVYPSPLWGFAVGRVEEIRPFSHEEIEGIRGATRDQLRGEKLAQEMRALYESAGLALEKGKLKDLAGLPREAVLARFTGGSVAAGEFRAFLERGGIEPAAAAAGLLESRLRGFAEDAVVKAFKEKELEENEDYVTGVGRNRVRLLTNLYYDMLYEGVAVSREEVERYYRENPAENSLPERVELFQIRLTTRAEADEVYRRLQEGYDFQSLAIQFAQTDRERQQAGFWGTVGRQALPDHVADVVFRLGISRFSEPVATRFGYYVFYVQNKLPAQELSLAEREEAIRNKLELEKKQKLFDDDLRRLKANYDINVDQAVLESL